MSDERQDEPRISRRDGLMAAGGLVAAALSSAPAAAMAGKPKIDFVRKIDYRDPKWNRDTYARLDADLDPSREKVGWLKGKVFGVRPNEKVRPLFFAEGFSVVRTRRLDDGSWRRMLRECVFYRDIETGQLIDRWTNPYTGEEVNVVPIANDPFNFTISEYQPEPPSYGGLNQDRPPRKPFLLDWEDGPNDTIILNTGINLFYPSALQPDQWPRESAGAFNRVSEQFIYVFSRKDAENPKLTHLPSIGSWSRITPWLPWMMMGQAEGHISYFTTFATLPGGVSELPDDIRAAAAALDPKFLSAPTEDYGPSLSSLENYKKEQSPSPVPKGWKPPAAAPAPTLPPKAQ